ncbi:MAG: glycosyltransferase family 4 protein [Deltaproteobacteria bacterium]|nr:glycosyltransferase family 4 protein [Deltaproteobacteria bacterium]
MSPDRVHTVYLGCNIEWLAITPERREAARAWLGESSERPLAAFIGGFGHDSRKGFDTLWTAWKALCARPDWDVDLIVAGEGRALPQWRNEIDRSGLGSRVRMLGFTERVADILAAVDVLVSPVRYESYGLNVQEAICCGVPAIVSRSAGVAERYPAELSDLLLPNPNDADDLAMRLLKWRKEIGEFKHRIAPLTTKLRSWTWTDMAAQMVEIVENAGPSPGYSEAQRRVRIDGESG